MLNFTISLVTSFQMRRTCFFISNCLNDDHMTAQVHHGWGELVPLVAVHGRFSYILILMASRDLGG